MKQLILAVKKQYFEEIKCGTKKYEYRLRNEYWKKRLENKNYDEIVITLGYPKKDDNERRLTFIYSGYDKITITHPHFGDNPVEVYAIKL